MRGFALTDALVALAVVSLVMAVLISRGPELEARESQRRVRAALIDAAQATFVMSESMTAVGRWTLYDGKATGTLPHPDFALIDRVLTRYADGPYSLTLQITEVEDGLKRTVSLRDHTSEHAVYEVSQ